MCHVTCMPKPEFLFLVMGESGSGKDTIVDYLCNPDNYDYDFKRVVSYTTRPKRPQEPDTAHKFIGLDTFTAMEKEGLFAASTCFDGHFYGAHWDDVNSSDFYIIDPAGLRSLLAKPLKRKIRIVQVTVDRRIRKQRMLERGDHPDSIERRIIHDTRVFGGMPEPDLTVVNDTSLPVVAEKIIEYRNSCIWESMRYWYRTLHEMALDDICADVERRRQSRYWR